MVLAALGKREEELELDPTATAFGTPERSAVRRQAARVWAWSLLSGAALAVLVSVVAMLVHRAQ